MSKCANCGTELAPGMKFCCECGTPVPQVKVCPDCGTELMPTAKFCFNCGAPLNGAPTPGVTGATVGGHAVVAGDVVSNVTNATYVTNADETKKVVQCHVCGKALTVIETYNCPVCGKPTCAQHYDEGRKMCTACRDKLCHDTEEAFRQTIREELTAGGGRLTQEALGRLRQRRVALGLEEVRGRELIAAERRVGEQTSGTKLTEAQRILLDKARQLVFNDGKCVEAVAEIDRILRGGVAMTDEIRTVLLPALLVSDEKRGDEIADRTLEDSLPVAFYRIDRALMHGDLPTAERALTEAERIWPDDIQLKCRRIVFTCALYEESWNDGYADKAAELYDELPEADDEEIESDALLASWHRYASNRVDLVMDRGNEIQSVAGDANLYLPIVYGRFAEPCSGPMRQRGAELDYADGCDCLKDGWDDLAVDHFRDAAESGHVKAMEKLAECYYNGKGVDKNYEEALKWYLEATHDVECSAYTLYSIGFMYENGQGVGRSAEEASKWYRKGADLGDKLAQCSLAGLYKDGKGVPQSSKEAAKWYRKSAEQGYVDAQCLLAELYEEGEGVPKSYEEAAKWYRKSAEQGNTEAQFHLAGLYEDGDGVSKSYEEAAKWYRKSAKQGDAGAQFMLARLYETGQGVPQSYEEAMKWYRKSAEQGIHLAQWKLGVMYEEGRGIVQSNEEAVKWYRKAAKQGNEDAQKALRRLNETW